MGGQTTLKQCLDKKTNPKEFEPYLNDYKIHAFNFPRLSKKQVDTSQSDIHIDADYFRKRIMGRTNFIGDRAVEHVNKVYIEGGKGMKREMTKEEYLKFMYNPKNSHKCDICPENRGEESSFEYRLPCGQQNCWVDCHCKEE